ncbi:SPW repeat protein [Dactylosporangium sp. CA-233914]|uniref:SPW repeat protein n=1 Tax=Dactylosporangium sp. CA-233914 TaxID=3239934 RepID=UPI003D9010D8
MTPSVLPGSAGVQHDRHAAKSGRPGRRWVAEGKERSDNLGRCVVAEVSQYQDFAGHPDIAEMQQRYERLGASGQAVVIDGLVLLAGGWLAISPWVIGFNASAPHLTVNNLILGIMIGVIALGLTMAPARMYRLSWAMVAIGVWVIISPWVVQRTGITAGMIATNVATGAVTALLGLGAVGLLMSANRRGRFERGRRPGMERGMERPGVERGMERPGMERPGADRPDLERPGMERRPRY